MMERKKRSVKKKVLFAEDVKQHSKAGMICTINGDTFCLFNKNTWIGDLGVLYHITNDDTGMYDITDIDEPIQGSSGIMPIIKSASNMLTYNKLMELNGYTFYGP